MAHLLQHRRALAVATAAALALALAWSLQDGRAGEKPAKGWLGVGIRELTPSLHEKLKLGNETGLQVTEVYPDSPADDAGLQVEDVIIQFDGKRVEQAREFSRMVRNAGADQKVTLLIIRAGQRKTFEVMLGKRRSPGYAAAFSHGFGPGKSVAVWMNRPRLGVQVHELGENLAAYFKVEPRSGVLVLEVHKESPAEKAGLKPGDVLVSLEGATVRDAEDLIESLQDYEEGDQVKIEFVRQGKRETATVEIDQSADSNFRFFSPRHERLRIQPFGDTWNDARFEALPPEFELLREDRAREQIHPDLDHEWRDEMERELQVDSDWGSRIL